MADLDAIAAAFSAPLSSTAASLKTKVVADAFRLLVPEGEDYVDSTVAIEKLEFASFAVGGLAAAATTPTAGARAESVVSLPLADSAGRADPTRQRVVQQRIVLYGPGDVRGIDVDQIVRRYPAPGTTDAEETTLAHIEFDRPELPWAFSAATAQGLMRPWLTLVVLDRSAVRWLPGSPALPMIEVPRDQLPSLARVHQWAHAQAAQADSSTTHTSVSLATRLSSAYAPANLSRLVSPRALEPDTEYLAAVVPATDAGVKAVRGALGGSLDAAWPDSSQDAVVLPVFDSWEFRTGQAGDFATLALRLKGVVAPYQVGRRFVDAREPGRPLTSLTGGEPGGRQVLRCALFSPSPAPTELATVESATWSAAKTEELTSQVNLAARLEAAQQPGPDGIPPIPVIGPRIYAKLQRGAVVVDGADWFAELNLNPMNRMVGGLGTRVVQRDQEQLMQAAWAQLGEVQKANRAIMLAQLAELLATRIHDRLTALEPGRLLQVAGPLTSRIPVTDGVTLAGAIEASATPTAVLRGAFRRTVRPGGPVLRHTAPSTREAAGVIVGTGATTRDFTRQYASPDGVAGLSALAVGLLDANRVGEALGVSTSQVSDLLTESIAALDGGVYAKLADPSSWQAPGSDFDLSVITARRWSEMLLTEPVDAAIKAVREQRTGPLLAQLALAPAMRTKSTRAQLHKRATTINNELVAKLGVRTTDTSPRIGRGAAPFGGVPRGPGGGIGRMVHGGLVDEMRAHPLGTAISRAPLGGVFDVPATPARRLPTGISGLNTLEVSDLVRLTPRATPATREAALRALADLAVRPVTGLLDRIATIPASALRDVMDHLIDPSGARGLGAVPRRATVEMSGLADALEPGTRIREALRGRLTLRPDLIARVFPPGRVRRVMAGPVFRRAMYRSLYDLDPEWLLPGLGLLPDTDFVTVLKTNPVFSEAFLIGLSDEFGKELLWRGYPTDQAFTYFRRFWDDEQDELPTMIHEFGRTPLGSHLATGGDGGSRPRAVIVVKSDLVRRYPDLIIQAVKNGGTPDAPQFDVAGAEVARQLFQTQLGSDVSLVGVDLSVEELNGPEWWITISEHPTATRFDTRATGPGRFVEPELQQSAVDFLRDRLHRPTRVAFRATDVVTV
ncbi:hypothetical protein PQI51_07525 [Microbacterium esteraromaticum]|uniref:hypothetical protein n=1 Tax=Microbacterium esteraromaticum TaxID=57043 RepID=UPI0030B47129